MSKIVAYTYDSAVHCPGCARERFGRTGNSGNPTETEVDEHGVRMLATDTEQNVIRPIFESDDYSFTHCSCQDVAVPA